MLRIGEFSVARRTSTVSINNFVRDILRPTVSFSTSLVQSTSLLYITCFGTTVVQKPTGAKE